MAKTLTAITSLFTALVTAPSLMAQDGLERIGKPVDKGMGFQPSASELARDITWLDGFLNVIIFGVVAFVVALLLIVIFRFNSKANPNPRRFTHHSTLEIVWTLVPVLILIAIGTFSLPILFKQVEIPEADINIKVTGYQWYWGYEYTDDGIEFEANMLTRDELAEYGYEPDEFLLATDNAVVVPEGKVVKLQITGADVIHSWAMPAMGVKMDAVPGRLNETWFKADQQGLFFGQCSELCGKDHSYMPIALKVVSEADYAEWLKNAKQEFSSLPAQINLASAE